MSKRTRADRTDTAGDERQTGVHLSPSHVGNAPEAYPLDAGLHATLELLAQTIVDALGFGVAVVNLVETDGALRVVAVAGPAETRDLLWGQRQSAASWQLLLESSEPWGRLRFLDHEKAPADPGDMLMWIPDMVVSDDPEAWHPEDALFAPLHDSEGSLLGILSVDLPDGGRRPGPVARMALEAFGISASLAIEHATLHSRFVASEQLFRTVFETSPIAIALTDVKGELLQVNPALCELLGYPQEDLVGHLGAEFMHPEDLASTVAARQLLQATGELTVLEQRFVRRDGSAVWTRLRVARLNEFAGEDRLLVLAEDITETKQQEANLRFNALHDGLTRLPNRTLVLERLAAALEGAKQSGELVAVLFCDLDRLKLVNDVHGHGIGDEFIRTVARRLRSAIRTSDIVGRIGGDEFVVVAGQLATPTEVLGLAGRVMDIVRRPLRIGAVGLAPSISMGIAYTDDANMSAVQILANADVALYEAKNSGRGGWRVFDAAKRTSTSLHLELRNQVEPALRGQQFELHYQPIVRLHDGKWIGFEALLRWRHPERGLLLPGDFLEVIVDSEYETPVTDWVIRQATHDAARWPDGSRPWVSVNVTAFQLGRLDLPEVVQSALDRSGLPAGHLVVELTEDRFLEGGVGETQLNRLVEMGVRIALDDFGTGFAGLGYVQRLPLDTLKIDQSFISGLSDDPASADIVHAICVLATARGMCLIAEGVETAEQLQALNEHGVPFAQGYLLGRPQPLDVYAAAQDPG